MYSHIQDKEENSFLEYEIPKNHNREIKINQNNIDLTNSDIKNNKKNDSLNKTFLNFQKFSYTNPVFTNDLSIVNTLNTDGISKSSNNSSQKPLKSLVLSNSKNVYGFLEQDSSQMTNYELFNNSNSSELNINNSNNKFNNIKKIKNNENLYLKSLSNELANYNDNPIRHFSQTQQNLFPSTSTSYSGHKNNTLSHSTIERKKFENKLSTKNNLSNSPKYSNLRASCKQISQV